jgi:hypothetical protein
MLPSATNAVAVNSSAARESGSASGGLSGACAAGSGSKSSSPSFGAGIGVGIAIAGGIAAGTALIWWLLHRRKTSTTPAELGGSRVQYPNGYGEKSQPTFKGYQGPVELHNESRSELPP